jgi:hypothetical protein
VGGSAAISARWARGEQLTPLAERPGGTTGPYSAGPCRLRLTPAGERHYAEHGAAYARLYPSVEAPDPDSAHIWPEQLDDRLADMRAECRRLRERLLET